MSQLLADSRAPTTAVCGATFAEALTGLHGTRTDHRTLEIVVSCAFLLSSWWCLSFARCQPF